MTLYTKKVVRHDMENSAFGVSCMGGKAVKMHYFKKERGQ